MARLACFFFSFLCCALGFTSLGAEPTETPSYIFTEAEAFQITAGDWQVRPWGTNYYAATFANSFLSRQRYLGAPEQGAYSEAAAEIMVPESGAYHACIRYEAVYNYETRFGLRVEQNGETLLRRIYGNLKSPKLWAFNKGIVPQVRWAWGPVENIVWEGTDVTVNLQKGPARLVLFKESQPAPAARRNIDLVMLTTDKAELDRRIAKERYLPLDGLLTQAGDLYLKIRNPKDAAGPVILKSNKVKEHSPYWVHLRDWKRTFWIDKGGAHFDRRLKEPEWLEPGEESPWIEFGSQLDSLNACSYYPEVVYPDGKNREGIDLEFVFGVPSESGGFKIVFQKRYRESMSRTALFSIPGNIRDGGKIRTEEEILEKLLTEIKKFPVRGRLPTRMLFYNAFRPGKSNRRKDKLLLEICLALGNNTLNDMPGWIDPGLARKHQLHFKQTSKLDCRRVPTGQLKAWVRKLKDDRKWPYAKIVSLGDEIHMGKPMKGKETDQAFRAFLQQQGFQASYFLPLEPAYRKMPKDEQWQLIKYDLESPEKNPELHYYAHCFAQQFGIDQLKERTDILRKGLPKGVLVGANYSPHPYFQPKFAQWIDVFRQEAMTMPWSEDYIWQIPVASQQILGYMVSAMQCAARAHEQPIYMYVMPHTPGNTPSAFRRNFYVDVAHGAKYFDFFSPLPTTLAYTENSMLPDSIDMYRAIYDVIREAGIFEDMIFPGKIAPAEVALLLSNSSDIWTSSQVLNAERQHLYLALKHAQIPVDFISEDDVVQEKLSNYRALYIAETHLKRTAAKALRKWVREGGVLFATAGAGLKDEYNQDSSEMRELLGVKEAGLHFSADYVLAKDNLPRMKPVDTLSYKLTHMAVPGSFDVYAAKAIFSLARPSLFTRLTGVGKKVEVLGTFKDKTPALFSATIGAGKVVTCAALPGTAYVKPAMPDRPCDRGATDDSYAHFLPTQFDLETRTFIARWALEAGIDVHILTSDDLVETAMIESDAGIAIPLINYRGTPIRSLHVEVFSPGTIRYVASVVHGKLKYEVKNGDLTVNLPLNSADMLMLRRYPPK